MDREDLENELLKQLQASANSSLFPASRLTALIQNSYKEATSLFKWVALSKALKTSTIAKWAGDDESYYDYPDEFRLNTVFRVQVDGKEYNRKSFSTFKDYRNRYGNNATKRIFASYQKFLFVSPDTIAGTNNMEIWGITNAPELSLSTSKTIFSDNLEAGNLAVIDLAVSTGMEKLSPKFAETKRNKAIITLGKLNTDEWDEYALEQQLDLPMFNVPDFFGKPDNNSNNGRFDIELEEHY